jgi:hypothetical protein
VTVCLPTRNRADACAWDSAGSLLTDPGTADDADGLDADTAAIRLRIELDGKIGTEGGSSMANGRLRPNACAPRAAAATLGRTRAAETHER